jgi:hypothetical protein
LITSSGSSGQGGAYEIEQSLRFDGSSAYLSRTPSSAGNRKTWTWSGWVKRAKLGAYQRILGGYVSATFDFGIGFNDLDSLNFYSYNSVLQASLLSTDKFRDTSAWYHIVYAVDTTQGTSSDRVKIYVNNRQITSFSVTTYPGASADLSFNSTNIQRIGQSGYPSEYFGGYLAEVNFIDGSALDPTDFGEYDDNGVWRPIKYAGSYTGNSFYLKFDAADVDGDSSGLGNDWTASAGISTSGTGTDVMSDTPTTNWATIIANNPTYGYETTTFTDGNLQTTFYPRGDIGNPSAPALSSITIPASGKWYYEFTTAGSNNYAFGIAANNSGNLYNFTLSRAFWGWYHIYQAGYPSNGDGSSIYGGASGSASGGGFINVGDIIGVEIDIPSGSIVFKKNGSSYASITSCNFSSYTEFVIQWGTSTNGISGSSIIANFGQRSFSYTPPTGYKALNTANLPAPDIKDGSKYFKPLIYLPDGSSSFSVTGVGFQPDLVWIKSRNYSEDHQVNDSLRGATKAIQTNIAGVEVTQSNGLTSFDSDGFTVGNLSDYNYSGDSIISWNWKEGTSNGLDIVSYEGTGSTQTISHNLGVPPAFVIVKTLDNGRDWYCYHQSLGAGKTILLSYDGGAFSSTNYWNNTAPSSTVFTVGSDVGTNELNNTYIAYCFAEVEGYSKFGSYTGNGDSSNNGPFVYLGFKPVVLIFKRASSGSSSWYIFDVERDAYNPANRALFPTYSANETSLSTNATIDFLSNGFKLRCGINYVDLNNTGDTYIYAAFASNPFGGSGVSPATAR